jgi:anti-sigma factor RsiW
VIASTELTCRELVELVTDYLEGALPRRERRRFERHIAGCDGCTAYLEQMRVTIRTLGTISEDDVEPAARKELLAAFRDWHAGR